jgi:chemotaxis protein methyltransferase CheR
MVEQATQLRDFLDVFQYDVQRRWLNIFVTAAQALRGDSFARGASWRGTPFDDERDLPDMEQSGDRQGLLFAYCTKAWVRQGLLFAYCTKAWVATLFGDHSSVEKFIDLAQYNLKTGAGLLENASIPFIYGLRYARELRENPDRPESEQALQEQLSLLERFAGLAPMNFAHKLSLVQAEVHRARGEVLPAMKAYEQASQGARENDYLNEAGLAHALAAEFYQDLVLQQAALQNLEQAALDWQNWGAHALVESLEERFADLLETSGISGQYSTDEARVQKTITQPVTSIQLDMESIISASQMLSAEIDLEQLLTKMITLVMANSGAEKAVLLLRQDNDWFVQARGDITSEKYDILLNQPFDPVDSETYLIPESVFNYCRRSKEVLVVGNAMLDQRFSQDRTIQKYKVISLACFPVLNQGKLKAMLYLENCQLTDVFTLERQQVIKHLSAQFGISVENVMLYDGINSKKKELEVSETRFRSLVENADEAIVVAQDDLVKYANEKVEELTGYSAEEMTKMNFEKFIHPDDLNTVLSEYRARLSGEKLANKYSIRIISQQGQTKYVYVNSARIDWDDRPATLALITDITQLKKAEEEVRQAYDEIKELKEQLQAEKDYLQQEIKLEHNFESIIGQSEALKYVLNRVEKVAPTDFPALIMGETGTGKELIARAIHELSPRSNRAMVKVNCAALPAELIESELFGREKGAYTGAATAQAGRFELANGSTLFLDEIGELPLGLQAKLLRVLESGEFERLGSSRTLHSDARIIAATNRELEEEVRKGRFRDDLWYRIKVFPITVPPLRDRHEDIPLLVQSFLNDLCRKMGKTLPKISSLEMKLLQKHSWPGNIRELRHSIESALINAEGNKLNFELPIIADSEHTAFKSFEETERDYILRVLKAKQWRIGGAKGAASILDLNVNTLRGKMKKLGIEKPRH